MSKHSAHKFHQVLINDLRFIDSYGFLTGSLADLAKQFLDNGNKPIYTVEMLKDLQTPALPLLMKGKQIMCYDYLNSSDRLDETCLPPREEFLNSLDGKELSESDYEHDHKVSEAAGCETLKGYVIFYVKVDVGASL